MAPFTVPPAVASRIARLASTHHTLSVLARTTRTFQEAAEKLLYDYIDIFPHPSFFRQLDTLARCPRVARYVRSYVLQASPQYRIAAELQRTLEAVAFRREFWERISASLAHLRELDLLIIVDPTAAQTWILDSARSLRACEMQLAMAWDEHVAEFLKMQDRLRCLTILEVAENTPIMVLPRDSLPCLYQFEGPLMIVDLLLHCPITHLKFPMDSEDSVSLLPLVLSELSQLKKLRSLSITMLPADMALQSVKIISNSCPNLQYLSHIPLPMDHKSQMSLLTSLASLAHLRVLELDVSDWTPPLNPPFQRAIATSLRMVLPKIKYVFFWGRYERTVWTWAPEEVEPIRVQVQGRNQIHQGVGLRGVVVGEGQPEGMDVDIDGDADIEEPAFGRAVLGSAGEGIGFAPAFGESGAAGAGAGAGIGAGPGAASAPEETISYVGLEGWRSSWGAGQNYANSTVWKTVV